MKSILFEYIIKNKKNFIIIITIFCIGIAIGTFFVNNSSDIQKTELSNYIGKLIENIKSSQNINSINLLFLSLRQNIGFILLIWFLGCTIIGGILIYIAILYKGFSIGYTIAAIVAVLGVKQGIVISIISLLFQNIIFLPVFFIISENGIKLYKGIYKRCINLREEVIRHTIIMLISIIFVIISSLIEVYFSTNLLIFLKEIL